MEWIIFPRCNFFFFSRKIGDRPRLFKTGKAAAHKRLHAQILLMADCSELGPAWIDKEISSSFDVSTRTVERVRQRLVKHGLEAAMGLGSHCS
ncbi:MAG: helix-turn-helix domain-containing protein [Desulfobulbaceae bacterium]|nr:helix-turn-helix domain-containing protein [Desulfobulbaceae bacterium]